MFQFGRLSTFKSLLLLFGTIAVSTLPLEAALDYFVGNPSFQRDYVLAGDSESPGREGVAVSESVVIGTNSVTSTEWATYRFAWTLEAQQSDGSWVQVPLVGSDTEYSAEQGVLLTQDSSDGNPSADIFQFDGILDPSSVLDPYTNYRVVGQLQRQPIFGSGFSDVESTETSSTSRLFEFTNTTSGDNGRNVIATLDSVTLSNPFLLDGATDPDKRGFTVDLSATARRWDDYQQSINNFFITFRYEVELREVSTGNVIPLQNTFFQKLVQVPSYAEPGSVPIPSTQSFADTLNLIPSEQLDPVNETYEVEVTITHVENPSTNFVKTGNAETLLDQQIYDFNGELHFGGNVTTLQDFTRAPQPTTSVNASYIAISLSGVEGYLSSLSDYTYDAPSTVSLHLLSDGSAVVQSVGAAVPVTPPSSTDDATLGNVRFVRENTELLSSGLESDLTVYLPQGMSYVPVGNHPRSSVGTLNFSNQDLNDQLEPTTASLSFVPVVPVRVLEESKPAYVLAESIDWSIGSGAFTLSHPSGSAGYVRSEESDYLGGAPVSQERQVKPDNSGYYRALSGSSSVSSTIQADTNGTATLTAAFLLGSGNFKTHFPLDSGIVFSGGSFDIDADAVIAGQVQLSDVITLAYDQTCVGDGCGSGTQTGSFTIDPDKLTFTADGGLVGQGPLTQPTPLQWGYIDALSTTSNDVYAQSLSDFTQGTYHMSGHFIRGQGGNYAAFGPGGAGDIAARNGPSDTLLAAVKGNDPADASVMARPGSTDDQNGQFYYPGINLETSGDGAVTGVATIAGQTVPYSLRGCNKFYVREVGVTGTLEAVPGSFPNSLNLYGYDFTFDYYGLGYLDSTTSPQRSFTRGSVSVPLPTDEVFAFEGLSFTCLGGLDEARLPDGGLATVFRYWNADIDVSTLSFTSSDSCSPGADAFLTLGATAYSTLIDQSLHGTVGVRPNGELINRDFSIAQNLESEITSRFRLPNNVKIDGPNEEQYDLTTVSEAYLNNFAKTSEQSPGDGRLNFAAKIDVPFFEDLAAHVRTTASKNTNPDAVLNLMGGWTENGQTFFSTAFFDTLNRGFPDGVEEALYRNESGASGDPKPYLISARQSWLNVVNLEYPLEWSGTLRSFAAYEPVQKENLLIIQVDHQLEYLSAENAEISFGAQYEGLPRINLTNFVFNKIDEQTGVLQAATDALQEEAVGALDDGLTSLDNLLQDRVDALLDEFLTETVDPIIGQLYVQLDGVADDANATVNDWQTDVQAATDKFFVQNIQNPSDNIRSAIKDLAANVDNASSVINKIDTSLEDVQLALRSVHDRIYIVDNKVQLAPPAIPDASNTIEGLLKKENGEFRIVERLIQRLIAEVGGELGNNLANMLNDTLSGPTGELENLINEQLEKVSPTLERIRTVITELDDRIGTIRSEIQSGTSVVRDLQDILDAADSQIQTATVELRDTVNSLLLADIPAPDRFVEYTEAELKQRIRSEIKDKLREMAFIGEFQQVIRQQLYDIDLAIKEGIDSAFAQVNTAIKDLLSSYLASFDDSINGVLGEIDSVVGAGELDGFAHINGDALRLLRIDASIQFKVPKEMEFAGYFQIKQLASDGTGSCSYNATGTPAKEITLGTPGVPVEWLSPGMELAVEGKVTYSDRPLGLGGKIEMVGGSFGFEAFTITDLGAAMSFGKTENYLAAKVGLRFQSYDIYGGVFFGQTCTITPVELVNEEAANVIGSPDPTFTGAYVYGEAHIPVSEAILGIPASCMFKITAGVGAGAFYFVEEPTFGGQILLAVSGEALCLVGINGEITMIGVKQGGDLRFSGRGSIGGRVGSCPFCVKFSKSLILEYINDRWKFQL